MLIMQVFPNFGRKMQLRSYAQLRLDDTTPIVCPTPVGRRNTDCMPNSSRKIWLWLCILTLDALPDSSWHHDSGRISWLRPRNTAPFDERAACLTTLAKDFTFLGKMTVASYSPDT
jgi:hypothetical protein